MTGSVRNGMAGVNEWAAQDGRMWGVAWMPGWT